ncbi:MAG: hypothetical protein VW577_00605 [Pelagibacteraceae bacterium]
MRALREKCRVLLQSGNAMELVEATIIGRTIETSPRYDVRLDSGKLVNNVENQNVYDA